MLCPQKNRCTLYFLKNISCIGVCLLRIGHVFSVYCKIMYLRVTTNCCFMSDVAYYVAVESGVQSLGIAASNRYNVRAPDDRRVWSIGRMAITKGNLSARWNILPSATSLTKNPTWTVFELNWASAAKNLRLREQSRHSRTYTKIGYLNIGLPTNTSIHPLYTYPMFYPRTQEWVLLCISDSAKATNLCDLWRLDAYEKFQVFIRNIRLHQP
jgi:hypothetical protein